MVWQAQVVVKERDMRMRMGATPAMRGQRGGGGGVEARKERLYALRRRFVVVVDANAVAIKVLGAARPWWSTAQPQQVVVKNKLVKITDENKRTIIIRLVTEEKALEFAAAVSERGGIDPLMHNAAVRDNVDKEQKQLEEMAALFMSSHEFRAQIQQLHGRLEELWSL